MDNEAPLASMIYYSASQVINQEQIKCNLKFKINISDDEKVHKPVVFGILTKKQSGKSVESRRFCAWEAKYEKTRF